MIRFFLVHPHNGSIYIAIKPYPLISQNHRVIQCFRASLTTTPTSAFNLVNMARLLLSFKKVLYWFGVTQ